MCSSSVICCHFAKGSPPNSQGSENISYVCFVHHENWRCSHTLHCRMLSHLLFPLRCAELESREPDMCSLRSKVEGNPFPRLLVGTLTVEEQGSTRMIGPKMTIGQLYCIDRCQPADHNHLSSTL